MLKLGTVEKLSGRHEPPVTKLLPRSGAGTPKRCERRSVKPERP